MPVAPNVQEQKFNATRPNQIWVRDIAYLLTGVGWLCLAGYIEIFDKQQCKQARLGYPAPGAFERQFHERGWLLEPVRIRYG